MDKLIKKIDSLQPEHHFVDSYENEPNFDDGWSAAINAVGDLIESEMVWKNRPDSGKGWYWYKEGDRIISPVEILNLGSDEKPALIAQFPSHTTVILIGGCKGEWQKAIMPKE